MSEMQKTIAVENLPKIAAKRGTQTLWQGLLVVVGVALLTTVVGSLAAGSWAEWIGSWQVWTFAALQAGGTALLAYVVRLRLDSSGVKDDPQKDADDGVEYVPEHAILPDHSEGAAVFGASFHPLESDEDEAPPIDVR